MRRQFQGILKGAAKEERMRKAVGVLFLGALSWALTAEAGIAPRKKPPIRLPSSQKILNPAPSNYEVSPDGSIHFKDIRKVKKSRK